LCNALAKSETYTVLALRGTLVIIEVGVDEATEFKLRLGISGISKRFERVGNVTITSPKLAAFSLSVILGNG